MVTKGNIEEVITGINDLKVAQNAFQEPEVLNESRPTSTYAPNYSSTVLQMWPAQLARDHLPAEYMVRRDHLASTAYTGLWAEVFHHVEVGRAQHFESWINAAKLGVSASSI